MVSIMSALSYSKKVCMHVLPVSVWLPASSTQHMQGRLISDSTLSVSLNVYV